MKVTPDLLTDAFGSLTAYVENAVEVLRFGGLQTDEQPSAYDVVVQRPMFRLRRYFPPAEGEEHRVVAGEVLHGRVDQDPVGERDQVRLQRAQRRPGVAARGEGADLDPRVREQEAEQLASCVSARAGHGDSDRGPVEAHDA